MNAAHFKKTGKFLPLSDADAFPEIGVPATNEVIRPDISVFHHLPKIAPPQGPQAGNAAGAGSMASGASSYDEGVRAGQAQSTQLYAETIKLMETALETLRGQYGAIKADIEASHLNVFSQCLQSILPDLAARSAEIEITELVRSLSVQAIRTNVQIRTHPDNLRNIQQMVGTANDAIFEIIEDENLERGAVAATWSGGGVDIDTASASQHCLAALDKAIGQISVQGAGIKSAEIVEGE